MLNNYEHLKFLIERFDHYYDSVNNKGNAMLVINTFSIGGLAAFYTALQNDVNWSSGLKAYGILLCLLWTVSLSLTSWALLPYRKSASNSLIFFGGISNLSETVFLNRVSSQNDEDLVKDMQHQVYYLARGLALKFKLLGWATYVLFASYVVLVAASIVLFTNLK